MIIIATKMKSRQTKLSITLLKGLLTDFVHGTVKHGVYFFNQYAIIVKPANEMTMREYKTTQTQYGRKPYSTSASTYQSNRSRGVCGRCGSDDLHIRLDGQPSVYCNACTLKRNQERLRRKKD